MVISARQGFKVDLQVIIGIQRCIYLAMVKYEHLGDNAAGSATTAIGIDGSGGRGLNLWSVGGDGEEGSEEIHWCVID